MWWTKVEGREISPALICASNCFSYYLKWIFQFTFASFRTEFPSRRPFVCSHVISNRKAEKLYMPAPVNKRPFTIYQSISAVISSICMYTPEGHKVPNPKLPNIKILMALTTHHWSENQQELKANALLIRVISFTHWSLLLKVVH